MTTCAKYGYPFTADVVNELVDLAGQMTGNTTFITTASDFPAPSAGVITLPADTTWLILDDVDLAGDRIVCAGKASIVGLGAETCKLRSTGLAASQAMIYSTYTLTLRTIGLYSDNGTTCVKVDGNGQPTLPALDWALVNFNEGAATPGKAVELNDVANCVNNTIGAFGDGYYVTGAIDSLVFTDSFLSANDTKYGIKIDAAATVTRRLRCTDSVFVAGPPGATAIDSPLAAFALVESHILNFVNFSGSGTRVTGVTYTDDAARWKECRGIQNSTRFGMFTWENNATVTTISAASTFYKIQGTSTPNALNQRFSHANNQLTYDSELGETFLIRVTATIDGGANDQVAIKAYKNGVQISANAARTTINTGGRADGLAYQEGVALMNGDYLELFIANETDTTDVTVTDLVFIVEEL